MVGVLKNVEKNIKLTRTQGKYNLLCKIKLQVETNLQFSQTRICFIQNYKDQSQEFHHPDLFLR